MVKVVAHGYKITHGKYIIEINIEDFVTTITTVFRKQNIGGPAKYLETIEEQHPIDALFKGMDFIYEHNKRNNKPM